ncbi:MAG: shikimate dehydrogenase [Pirellulaceae bacterium]|nr:shikimate dehydrogenase [Pirellulaceae bacterium]
MICVSIGRGRHKQVIAEHRHLVEQGAKLVEIRLDYIRRAVDLKRLLDHRPCPVIATCRRERDGGKWVDGEEKRLMLIRSVIANGVDYVDLEEDIADQIPRFGKTKRIVSYHNFNETPEDLESIHARMAQLDPDVIKITTMAHHPHDNVRVLGLVKSATIPTVGMCMGDIGTPSRLLCGRAGSPFTYATFHAERTLAPGQLSYRQMVDIYNYDLINAETEIYGVVADPVGHSLSPLIHNAAFRELGMNKVYIPFRVPPEDLGLFMGDCRELGVKGLSVTIPHKEDMVRFLDKIDESTSRVGATNTVLFGEDELRGYNTDLPAAMDSIYRVYGQPEGDNPFGGKVALMLGAGGVAKAIAYGLKIRGAEVFVTARNETRATNLAERLDIRTIAWKDRVSAKPQILINATPVGMHPNVNLSPYDGRKLERGSIVFDVIYNPEQTLLIKEAKKVGCRVITGVDMFVQQAALQFKHFTGEDAPIEVMRNAVRQAIGAAKI